MKVLIYFFKNVHIPLFEPIIRELQQFSIEILFASPDYQPQLREGLSLDEKQSIQGGRWLANVNSEQADVALMADCVADRLQFHRCIINIGHGLISKGQYYSNSPLIGRENLANIICVPGLWHKESLSKYIHIPIEVTGMSKLDSLFSELDKESFCQQRGINPNKKIILWAPTFNMELSGIPVIWKRIRQLTPFGQVLIKLHGTTDPFFKRELEQFAQATPDLFYIHEQDTTPFMKISDLLITDVSSVMFEYTALDKPIVLVDNPHQEDYRNYKKDDVEYFWRDIGPRVSNPQDLITAVEEQLKQPNLFQSQRQRCFQGMFAASDGRNSYRIAQVVLNHQKIVPDYSSYDVVLGPQIEAHEINICLGGLQPRELWLHDKFKSIPINASFTIRYFERLKDISMSSHPTVFFSRAAQLMGKWQKPLLGRLGKTQNTTQCISPLSASSQVSSSKVTSFLKVHQYQVPQPITPENLSEFIRLTNPGETKSLDHDSPVTVYTPEGFRIFSEQESSGLTPLLALDVLCI